MKFSNYLNNSEFPTKEMKDFFTKRLEKHRKMVDKSSKLLIKKFPEINATELKERTKQHDLSKFGPKENLGFIIYHWFKYNLKDTSKIPAEYKDIIEASREHHKQYEMHHPEVPGRPAIMNLTDIAEMCCDFAAASIESGNDILKTSMEIFSKRNINFNPDKLEIIRNILSYLESKRDLIS